MPPPSNPFSARSRPGGAAVNGRHHGYRIFQAVPSAMGPGAITAVQGGSRDEDLALQRAGQRWRRLEMDEGRLFVQPLAHRNAYRPPPGPGTTHCVVPKGPCTSRAPAARAACMTELLSPCAENSASRIEEQRRAVGAIQKSGRGCGRNLSACRCRLKPPAPPNLAGSNKSPTAPSALDPLPYAHAQPKLTPAIKHPLEALVMRMPSK